MIIAFTTTVSAILKLFLISLGGYGIVRFGIFKKESINDLARLILYLLVPSLLFVKMFGRFNVQLLRELAVIPVASLLLTMLAGFLALGGGLFLRIPAEKRNVFFASVLFGNSGYIPIPLVLALFPGEKGDLAVLYISLFLLVFSPMLWTLGVYLVGRNPHVRMPLRSLLSPPFVGILLGVCFSLIPPLRHFLEGPGSFLVELGEILGDATVPMAMVLIGAVIAGLEIKPGPKWKIIAGISFLKLFLLPALVILILYFLPLPNLVRFVIALEAAVPPATNLVVIARTYQRPADLISLTLFVTYLTALVTIPLFILLSSRLFPV